MMLVNQKHKTCKTTSEMGCKWKCHLHWNCITKLPVQDLLLTYYTDPRWTSGFWISGGNSGGIACHELLDKHNPGQRCRKK